MKISAIRLVIQRNVLPNPCGCRGESVRKLSKLTAMKFKTPVTIAAPQAVPLSTCNCVWHYNLRDAGFYSLN